MIRAAIPAVGASIALSACAGPMSFAPPEITVNHRNETAQSCALEQPVSATVNRDVPGAFEVVDLFLGAYRCRANSTADGKQIFDIPAFAAVTGGAAAAALGTGPTVGILAQTGNAVFNAGKAYYDPVTQSGIINDAVGALLCVRNHAAGVDHFNLEELADAKEEEIRNRMTKRGETPTGSIQITVEAQFYDMVSGAAMSIDHVARHRLRSVGTLDSDGVAKSIIDNAQKLRDAQKKKDDQAGSSPGAQGFTALSDAEQEQRRQQWANVDLAVLSAALQSCIDLAKI